MAFPGDYSLYGEVTIDHTLVGSGGVTGQAVWLPVSNVPAAVVSGMRSDGGDVRFTLSDGTTQIPGYAELNSAGTCIGFWFKTDLSDSVDTDIRLWYNGTDTALAVGDTYGQHAVFSGDSLQILLNSDPTGSSPQFSDRTANGNDASTDGTFVVGDSQDGLLGKCINLNGSNQRLIAVDDASIDFTSAFTISIVVNIDSLPTSGNFMSLISKYDAGGNNGGYDLHLNNDGGTQKVELVIAHPTTPTTLSVTHTLPTGQWIVLTATCDGSDAFLYLNGTQIGTSSSVTPMANSKNLFIGAFGTYTPTSGDLGRYFDGKVNIVSLFPVAKSAAWIETRYNNFIDPSAFFQTPVVELVNPAFMIWNHALRHPSRSTYGGTLALSATLPSGYTGEVLIKPSELPSWYEYAPNGGGMRFYAGISELSYIIETDGDGDLLGWRIAVDDVDAGDEIRIDWDGTTTDHSDSSAFYGLWRNVIRLTSAASITEETDTSTTYTITGTLSEVSDGSIPMEDGLYFDGDVVEPGGSMMQSTSFDDFTFYAVHKPDSTGEGIGYLFKHVWYFNNEGLQVGVDYDTSELVVWVSPQGEGETEERYPITLDEFQTVALLRNSIGDTDNKVQVIINGVIVGMIDAINSIRGNQDVQDIGTGYKGTIYKICTAEVAYLQRYMFELTGIDMGFVY